MLTLEDDIPIGRTPDREAIKAASGTLVAGRPWSTFYAAGIPGPAAIPTPGIAGVALTTYPGQIPWVDHGAGQETRIARFLASSSAQPGRVWLCDRLWHNSGISPAAGFQAFTGAVAIPARDEYGAANGHGVYFGLEVAATMGASTPGLTTLTYTNTAGVGGRTGTVQHALLASAPVGSFHVFDLAAGDVGVQKADGINLQSSWTSGTMIGVLFRKLAVLPIDTAGVPAVLDHLTHFAKMYNGSVPFLVFVPSTATSTIISADLGVTQR